MQEFANVLVVNPGERLTHWHDVFPLSFIVTFGDDIQDQSAIFWFKLDGMDDAEKQIDEFISRYHPEKLIVLANIPVLSEALMVLGKGARAYVNAYAGPDTLLQIADVVGNGGLWLGEDLMQLFVLNIAKNQQLDAGAVDKNWKDKVSAREIEIVEEVLKGASNKVIAKDLNISERTVKAHLTSIYEKLAVKDRLQLVLKTSLK